MCNKILKFGFVRFGFVLLSDFIMPNDKQGKYIDSSFEMHKRLKASGALNFLKCRHPVELQLHTDEWSHVLQGYWDVQLIQLLKYRFPLDFNRDSPLECENKNLSSAVKFSDDAKTYLNEEVAPGAILGPFTEPPIHPCDIISVYEQKKTECSSQT